MAENQFYLIQLILIGFEAILEILFLQIRQKAGRLRRPLGWDDPRPRHFPAEPLPVVFTS